MGSDPQLRQTQAATKERALNGRFVKGAGSPNPGGQTKTMAQITALARDYCPAAIRSLARIAIYGKKDADRIAAAQLILERGLGKAVQPVTLGMDDGSAMPMEVRFTIIDPVAGTTVTLPPPEIEGTAINADERSTPVDGDDNVRPLFDPPR
jgi:hypothetical protein